MIYRHDIFWSVLHINPRIKKDCLIDELAPHLFINEI